VSEAPLPFSPGHGATVANSAGDDTYAASRWLAIEELFHRALTFPPDQRPSLISSWCGADAAMATELLALLASNDSVEDLISASQTGPIESQAFLLRNGVSDHSAESKPDPFFDPWIDRVLGAYRLRSLLGRGGMGVVYLAERVSQANQTSSAGPASSTSPTVAVKLLGRHLHSSPAVEQFQIERNALAQLEHPNIARLLDGGVTSEGIPYLVMELIEGRRLDEFCDDPSITVEQILRLMLQLCGAISYVHRNLILHRDLKPGNVMVTGTASGSSPAAVTVKLLDFGTLKRIGPGADPDSAMTQAGMRAVTLRYASPEHIQGGVVSTASDTYSLGMILYRLVAGQLPSGHTPSSLDRLPVGPYLDSLKSTRFAPPTTLSSKRLHLRMAHDLDAVILKAIAWEPSDRYSSAGDLAADLTNLLESRPVSARNGTLPYLAARYYQRHTRSTLAAAAVLFVLGLGVAIMARESRVARAEAQRAEAGVEQERNLAHLLLFDYFDQLKQIPGSTEAQRKAVTMAIGYLDGLSRASVGPAIELDNIKAYTSMGALLDSPYEENIGDEQAAIATLRKAISLAQQLNARSPHNLEYQQASAAAETELGAVYLGAGDLSNALTYLKSAADTSLKVAASPGVTAPMLAKSASVVDGLVDVYFHDGTPSLNDPDRASQTLEQVQGIYHHCLQIDSSSLPCRRGLAISFYKLGLLNATWDPYQSENYFTQSLNALHSFPADQLAMPRNLRLQKTFTENLAAAYLHTGHAREGVRLFQAAQNQAEKALAADPVDARARWDLISAESSLADGYEIIHEPALEEESLRGYLENTATLVRLDPANESWAARHADAVLWSGKAAEQRGDHAAAARLGEEGLKLIVPMAEKPGAEPYILDLAANYLLFNRNIAAHRDAGKDAALALSFAQRALKLSPIPSPSQWLNLADAQRATGQLQSARTSAQTALGLLAKHPRSVRNAEQRAHAQKLLAGN
jgi:non-specific serine/threonine protein kinase/serine/threonine-protein kinase